MYVKMIFAVAAIAASLGMILGMATVPYSQTAVADKGDQPNDSAQFGPASFNYCDRHGKIEDIQDEKAADDNPNNDNGLSQANQNMHDLRRDFQGTAC